MVSIPYRYSKNDGYTQDFETFWLVSIPYRYSKNYRLRPDF